MPMYMMHVYGMYVWCIGVDAMSICLLYETICQHDVTHIYPSPLAPVPPLPPLCTPGSV